MNTLIFHTGSALELTFERAALEPGLAGCRLALFYTARPRQLGPVVILLGGELRAELAGGERWLGALHGGRREGYLAITSTNPAQAVLSLSLGFEQLLALEHARAGDDLRLRIDLRAAILGRPRDQSLAVPPDATSRLSVTIHRDEWARELDRVGAAAIVPILVPIPVGGAGSRLGEAGRHLRDAQQALRDNRPEDAVRVARLALEIIRQVAQEPEAAATVPRKQRRLPERFAAVREDLFSLASGAAHDDEVSKDFRYTLADAVAIIGGIAGLLARLEEQTRS